jgi:hypothetical protein
LLVFLLDTMVHIVEHHDFMPEDFLVEEEAASSTPRATNRPAPGAAENLHAAPLLLSKGRGAAAEAREALAGALGATPAD